MSVSTPLPWSQNDGGRAVAGFGGEAGDCVVRAIAIAAGQDYEATFTDFFALAKATPSGGVFPRFYRPYLEARGWTFVYTGRHRLTSENLPSRAKIIALMSMHAVAIIDGALHDTYDCSNGGRRHFYGYFYKEDPKEVRARIARRVRGLLQRTVENGATDEEADSAVALANKLMSQHALTFRDIKEVRVEEYAEAKTTIASYSKTHAVIRYPIAACLNAICDFACVEHWFQGDQVFLFGTRLDTDVAIGLVSLYGQQLARDLLDYQRSPEARSSGMSPATRRADYISAWTGSRNTRLCDLTRERKAPPPKAGVRYTEGTELAAPEAEQTRSRELMIVREQVLKEKYESHTKNWKWSRPSRSYRYSTASDPHARAAARSAEARGDLGIDRKLNKE